MPTMNAEKEWTEATNLLIELVDQFHIKQKDIAKEVGVTQQTISNWCHGRPPSRRNERKLNKALGSIKDSLALSALGEQVQAL